MQCAKGSRTPVQCCSRMISYDKNRTSIFCPAQFKNSREQATFAQTESISKYFNDTALLLVTIAAIVTAKDSYEIEGYEGFDSTRPVSSVLACHRMRQRERRQSLLLVLQKTLLPLRPYNSICETQFRSRRSILLEAGTHASCAATCFFLFFLRTEYLNTLFSRIAHPIGNAGSQVTNKDTFSVTVRKVCTSLPTEPSGQRGVDMESGDTLHSGHFDFIVLFHIVESKGSVHHKHDCDAKVRVSYMDVLFTELGYGSNANLVQDKR